MDGILDALAARIRDAGVTGEALAVRGGGSKDFLGRAVAASVLDTTPYRGIVDYDPAELVITARAGTPLAEVEDMLAGEGQILAFEPPRLGADSTLGGAIAAGLSGPARPWHGAARDFVLGTQVLNGRGERLSFGGRVMKNVAGYDVSRLLTGSMGCLAVLLEISLKVLPRPATELTLARECDETTAIELMAGWAGRPLPITAGAWERGVLRVRLAGGEGAVAAARETIGGDDSGGDYWDGVRDQTGSVFGTEPPLWRLSVPPATAPTGLPGDSLIDWGGAQRWLATEASAEEVRKAATDAGGHATLYRGDDAGIPVFHPLPAPVFALHRRLKAALDPDGIFNPGRMYEGL